MKIAFVEWPAALPPASPAFERIAADVRAARPDLLVTNEMPFGDWVWTTPDFDRDIADRSVRLHEAGLDALQSLGVPAIVSSRPVWAGERLANEAFALSGGRYQPLHHKHFFPSHPGWFEDVWFHAGLPGFALGTVAGLKVGVLLCTELMFNEHARAYGRAGADLIVAPRASGSAPRNWRTAAAMAALVSGSYVVSSNRVGSVAASNQVFGGIGLAFAPGGEPLGETSAEAPLLGFDLSPALIAAARQDYPCTVDEAPKLAPCR